MMLDKRMASYLRLFISPNGIAFRDTALECDIKNPFQAPGRPSTSLSCVERHMGEQSFRSKGCPFSKMAIHAAISGYGRLTDIPTRTRIRLAVY